MSIPREFIALLLARIDLVELINTHVPLRKKSASNYFARCPFHQEKSASFSVSQTKQFYYCFGCGAHGNAIDFMMQHERLSFPETIETLAHQVGMTVPQEARESGKNPGKNKESHVDLYNLMTAAGEHYYAKMRQAPHAIQYLKQRGLTGLIAQQFAIGYAPPGWQHLLHALGKTGADKKKLFEAGLTIEKTEGEYYDRFRDRIMFPIHDVRGRIIGFGGRILEQGEPKYLNSPETPLFQKGNELYGLYHALKANRKLERVLIVEGYMDVIALFQHGITYAVATLGTATTKDHLQRIMRYSNEIIFCFDGDQAGRTAASRALQVIFPLMHDQLQIRFLFLPEGEDPDSLVRREGAKAFEARLLNGVSLAQFFLQTLANESDLSTLEGRARFASLAVKAMQPITAPLFQAMLLEEISKRTRLDPVKLKQQLKPLSTQTPPTQAAPITKINLLAPLKCALALLIQQPKMVAYLDPYRNQDTPLSATPHAGLLLEIATMIRDQPTITTGILIEHFRDRPDATLINTLAQWDHLIPATAQVNAFKEALHQLQRTDLKAVIEGLLAKAAHEGLTDAEKIELSRLINQKNAAIDDKTTVS